MIISGIINIYHIKCVRISYTKWENSRIVFHTCYRFLGNLFGDYFMLFFLKTIEIKRSYEPPRRAYGTHLANIMINFNNYLEDTTGLINSITHFEHYVKEFMTYYQEKFQKHPITFSAWSQSNLNSLFSTGLAISIADIPFDNDDRKYEEFMNTDAFNFYKKVCLNRGFSVHQHIPYILVADLGSPAITKYIDINLNVLINTYYNKCYNIDYIIGNEVDVPNCIKMKKVNEISFKTARRNFLLKQNIVNSNLFLIVNKECK